MQLLSACNRMRPVIVLEIFERSTCSSHLLVFIRVRLFVCLSCFKLDVVFGVCVAFLFGILDRMFLVIAFSSTWHAYYFKWSRAKHLIFKRAENNCELIRCAPLYWKVQ